MERAAQSSVDTPGKREAIEQLKPREYPACFAYLGTWAYELLGRSGVGMSGYAPLSHAELEAWSRTRDVHIEPHEVETLMAIDNVLRNPDE